MITEELIKQAIKETAEGMLSGDPNYAAKCAQTVEKYRVRLFSITQDEDDNYPLVGAVYHGGKWRRVNWTVSGEYDLGYPAKALDLVPTPRKLQCWVRWYKNLGGKECPVVMLHRDSFPDSAEFQWVSDPILVETEEKH